jgi:hypothetical protein
MNTNQLIPEQSGTLAHLNINPNSLRKNTELINFALHGFLLQCMMLLLFD